MMEQLFQNCNVMKCLTCGETYYIYGEVPDEKHCMFDHGGTEPLALVEDFSQLGAQDLLILIDNEIENRNMHSVDFLANFVEMLNEDGFTEEQCFKILCFMGNALFD